MIETTFDIAHAGADANCKVDSNVGGELAQQAELVAFAHYVARVFLVLGPARAGAVVETLVDTTGTLKWPAVAAPSETQAIVRFVDGASGPRLHFRLNAHGKLYANLSVDALRNALRDRHVDVWFGERLGRVAELMARLGATGQVDEKNEFDVALAAADVAWRSAVDDGAGLRKADLECPACGFAGEKFEPRVWPSDAAVLLRCGRCGAGVWRRDGHRPRAIRPDIWGAMESMRAQLEGAAPGATAALSTPSLLGELKRVFVENGWSYSEVAGAPVLLTELAGPEGEWDFYAQAVEDKDLVLLYSIAPARVPESSRLEVSEFLTRANYGLADGNFELDFDDGEIRFKTVLHVQGEALDGLLVKRLVRANGTALETYLPSIGSMIDGATTSTST